MNVAWDGGDHAFLIDMKVHPNHRRHGIGTELVRIAALHAKAAGCEWMEVDFEEHLVPFYFGACGFSATRAGLLHLPDEWPQGPRDHVYWHHLCAAQAARVTIGPPRGSTIEGE